MKEGYSDPHFLFLKARAKTPIWKMPSLYWGRKVFLSSEMGSWGWEICKNFVTWTLIFLVTSPQFTVPIPNPSVLSILHKCIVSCLKVIKALWFWSLLQSLFSCEGSHIHAKNQQNLCTFSCSFYLMST